MPTLQVIIASTRPGRVGSHVARWFEQRVIDDGRFDVDLVDLKALDLPMMDEPHHPRLRRYEHQHTREWSARVQAADAFAFVTPEYNHGFTAPLKNAIDFLFHEWSGKPAGFVSYGGVSGGTRALEMLKQVVTAVGIVPTVSAVNIPFVHQFMKDGAFHPNEPTQDGASGLLDELWRLHQTLAPARREREQAA